MIEFSGEGVQQAIFLRQPPSLDAMKLWDIGFGRSPDGFQRFPDGNSQAQGRVDGAELTLAVQPAANRIDFHFQGLTPNGPPPVLESVDGAIEQGLAIMGQIVQHLSVGRLATVVQGSAPAAGGVEAVAMLKEAIPGFPAPPNTEEASYHVVVPRDSLVGTNRRISQICRWQVAQVQFVQLLLGGTVSPPASTRRNHVVHASIDVFTVDMIELSAEAALAELREVGAISYKIFSRGLSELG